MDAHPMNIILALRIMVAGGLAFGIAALFAIKLLSLKVYDQTQKPPPSLAQLPISSFYYNQIGHTPNTIRTSAIPLLSNLAQSLQNTSDDSSDTQKRYTVVVGHTKTQKAAHKVMDELNQAGLPTSTSPITTSTGTQMIRITMGQFRSQKEAEQASDVLHQRTSYEGKVVAIE